MCVEPVQKTREVVIILHDRLGHDVVWEIGDSIPKMFLDHVEQADAAVMTRVGPDTLNPVVAIFDYTEERST